MKRSLLACLLLWPLLLTAAPALRLWYDLRMADGTPVRATAMGDEWSHWFETADGRRLELLPDGTLAERNEARPANSMGHTALSMRARRQLPPQYKGQKRGLIILVDFPDKPFTSAQPNDTWNRIVNQPGYHDDPQAYGSVHDYFMEQSNGQLDLSFDVAGPVTASRPSAYYGTEDEWGNEIHVPELLKEACLAIEGQLDFSQYDWDGDGSADQVFLLYAGKGQNVASTQQDLIWAHMYWLEGWREAGHTDIGRFEMGGVFIDTYACCGELGAQGGLSGVGTICHEFSHCLGLPDIYNTDTQTSIMDAWDLMDQGNYNNAGWCPPNYSAQERAFCGWFGLTKLNRSQKVTGMKPLSDGGKAYRVTNDCTAPDIDEYYVLENRQQTGWDAYLPGAGLLITHVDYDEETWVANKVNTVNGHFRLFFIVPGTSLYGAAAAWPYEDDSGALTDSLTDTSWPRAIVFNRNRQGSFRMGKPIRDIRVVNGEASFTFLSSNQDAAAVTSALRPDAKGPQLSLQGRPPGPQGRGIVIERGRKKLRR